MNDLISIIVPVYNVEQYLEVCVQSIREQSYKNIEIILVDDGSTDRSKEICDELAQLDTRIKVLHKENGGLSSARNAGVDLATGKWVGFVDSDDLVHHDMYNVLSNIVDRCGKADVVSIGLHRFEDGTIPDQDKTVSPDIQYEEVSMKTYLEQILLHIGDISFCTKIFSRRILEEVRLNEEILNEDFEFWLRVIRSNNNLMIAISDVEMYFYRTRQGSITSSGYSKAIIDCVYNADRAYQLVQDMYPQMKDIAVRFCLVQNEQFMRRIPLELMVRDNIHYVKVIGYLRKHVVAAMCNRYVTCHQKRNILAFVFFPKLAKKVYRRFH